MNEIKIELDEVLELLDKPKLSGNKQYNCKCPICKQGEKFYINKETYLWDCKKCHEKGNIFKLLKHFGVLDQYLKKTIDVKRLVKLGETTIEEDNFRERQYLKRLPLKFERVFENKYLENRNWKTKDFYKYCVGLNKESNKLKDYIIYYIEDEIGYLGYVARCTLPKEEMELQGKLRYINGKGVKFSSILLGIEEVTRFTEIVVIVEGFFDKVSLDNLLETYKDDRIKVLCTFGNKVSEEQFKQLQKTNVKDVILFYDIDAILEMKRYAPKLKKYFNLEIASLVSGKDPGEASFEETLTALTNTLDYRVFFHEKCNGRKIKA